jgi:hypothetical protein
MMLLGVWSCWYPYHLSCSCQKQAGTEYSQGVRALLLPCKFTIINLLKAVKDQSIQVSFSESSSANSAMAALSKPADHHSSSVRAIFAANTLNTTCYYQCFIIFATSNDLVVVIVVSHLTNTSPATDKGVSAK